MIRVPEGAERPAGAGGGVPPRALGISVLALVAAGLVGFVWPESVEDYAGLVWLLALVPVFLLSYHRGWTGAAVAAALSMVALTAAEVVVVDLLGRPIEWQTFGYATVILIAVSFGAGRVTDLLHERNRLSLQMAYEDPLTGLANRRLIERDTRLAIDRAGRHEEMSPALLLLDIIRFKRVNDELGFDAGDEALTIVGQRIRNAIRESDTVARVGGDEFAVLMPASSGRREARAVAERIESALWRPLEVSGQRLRLGARVGHAVFPQDGETFDQLLSVASPGKEGRGERAWPLGLDGGSGRESGLSLEADLVDALEGGEQFRVFYQPVARLEDDAVVGFEALLRWQHPERGLLDAGAFVPAAEQMGIIHELERVLLRQAVAEASRWTERSLPLWTSVNLSLTSLEGKEGGQLLAELVDANGLPPSRLVVEVTERITARNPAVARRRLEELHDLGFRIAIDDFGTGHSSLAYLQRFPLDLLKVDRSFVSRLSEEDEHQRLVEGILGLAAGLDLDVVAEGVEVEGQRDWLRSAGCHQYQGYLLTRARPFGELDDLLENGGLSLGSGLAAEDRPA